MKQRFKKIYNSLIWEKQLRFKVNGATEPKVVLL